MVVVFEFFVFGPPTLVLFGVPCLWWLGLFSIGVVCALVLPWCLVPSCCLGVCLGVALVWNGLVLLGVHWRCSAAWWCCLVVVLGATWCYLGAWGLVGASTATGVDDDEQINGGGDRWRGVEHEQEC